MAAITLNLEDGLIEFLRSFSKKTGKTQRQIIEEGLRERKKKEWKQMIREETKKN